MASIDPFALTKWEKGEDDRGRVARGLRGVWHNYVPKLFGWTMSPWRLLFGAIRGLFFVALGLSPIWMKFLDGTGELSWAQAGISAALLAILTFNFWYDKIVKEYKPRSVAKDLKKRLSLELGGVIAKLACAVKRRSKDHEGRISGACNEMLLCIRDAARIYLGDHEGTHVEASLLVFNDSDCKEMRIAHRTTTSRPVGRVRKSEEVMAYYVARGQKHRVVHDFLNDPHPFPKESLSGGAPSYRSLLLIPLLDTSGGRASCLGVVTVDSTRPYHFWPANGQGLVVELKSYMSLLVLILNLNESHRLTCPEP